MLLGRLREVIMTERRDRAGDHDLHAEAERIAVPSMDLVVTTLEGMVDAVEALGRRGSHPLRHAHDATRADEPGG